MDGRPGTSCGTGARLSSRKSLARIVTGRLGKLARKRIRPTLKAARDPDALVVTWWAGLPNWGDALTPALVRLLSGREPLPYHEVVNLRGHPVYGVIGSLLDGAAILNLELWGPGFKHPETRCWIRPKRVHAVRGPLTRDRLRGQGVSCPDVLGDPCLLLPRLYRPAPELERRPLGIVPHHSERDLPLVRELAQRDDVRLIEVVRRDTWGFVDEIVSCDVVASSSLHGLIAAEAYGVPTVWLELSGRLRGGRFKFHDYYGSVGRDGAEPLEAGPGTDIETIVEHRRDPVLDIDLDRLLEACPFRSAELRRAS